MLGHIFPLFAGFKGGRVATLFGMILAVQPVIAVSCYRCFPAGIVSYPVRFISSILAAVCLTHLRCGYGTNEILCRAFALVVAGMVVFHASEKYRRILRGESRIPDIKTPRSPEGPPPSRPVTADTRFLYYFVL